MERLTGLDAGFVYAETPSWHMHAGALLVLDPAGCPAPFDIGHFRALVASRLDRLGLFRRRLVTVPLGLDRPAWVEDPDLDLEQHIRAVAAPTPGGPREVGRLVGELFACKLEPHRPLWEIWFIEGLEHGYVGLLVKVHHALTDGARGASLYEVMFDVDPFAPFERPPQPATPAERVPPPLEMLARSLPGVATIPLRALRTAAHLGRAGVHLVRFRQSSDWRAVTFPFQAPRTSFNHAIDQRRDVAFCSFALSDTKAVAHAFGVTVNDVVLAVCGGALRRYLSERGELPAVPLVAEVPVAVRVNDPSGPALGNRISVFGAALATQVADPVERLRAIHRSTASAKAMHEALGEDLLLDLADVVPPAVLGAAIRAYSRLGLAERHPPIFNLIVSNVRGPAVPLYVGGARLVANFPIGPLLDGSGLNITVLSYLDSVDFGFAVCPGLVPDPWALVDAARRAFAELGKAATRAVARTRPRHPPTAVPA